MPSSHKRGKRNRADSFDPLLFSRNDNKEEIASGRITVYVDDKEVCVYRGMRVRHALTSDQVHLVEMGGAEVRDSYGHVVGLDGALNDGQRLALHRRNK